MYSPCLYALALLDEAFALSPTDPVRTLRAMIYEEIGCHAKAVPDRRALCARKPNPSSLLSFAIDLHSAGE
jgi:hypothetical protein